jgi:hypothetical protein
MIVKAIDRMQSTRVNEECCELVLDARDPSQRSDLPCLSDYVSSFLPFHASNID